MVLLSNEVLLSEYLIQRLLRRFGVFLEKSCNFLNSVVTIKTKFRWKTKLLKYHPLVILKFDSNLSILSSGITWG